MTLLTLAYDADALRFDIKPSKRTYRAWLQNAITVSLFTDARCASDELPQGETDQRGYWGDIELPEGESLGSKLWTLKRKKVTQQTIGRVRDYAEEALQWLVNDGHLQSVNVTAERSGLYQIDLNITCQISADKREDFLQHFDIGEAA